MRQISLVLLLVAACNPLANRTEKKVCERLESLCGEEPDECVDALVALEEPMGASYDKALTCAAEARSCGEALGCLVGGMGSELMRFGTDFGTGMQKMMR